MEWFEFKPVDTIFFRGAEPMSMGESHTSKLNFPPPLTTLTGALRTAILRENNLRIDDYYAGKIDNNIFSIIGDSKGDAGFTLNGPFFSKDGDVFIPAPYSWYAEKSDDIETIKKVKVLKSEELQLSGIKTSGNKLQWVKNAQQEVETLGGKWLKLVDFNSGKNEIEVYSTSHFYDTENRVGIALEKEQRKVREGHIYQFNHVRLRDGYSILLGSDKELPLPQNGTLTLGAEGRFGQYNKINNISDFQDDGNLYMNLSPYPADEQAKKTLIASGRPLYLGGWDMQKGFHKDMLGYYPQGSVFSEKLNQNFISI